MFKETLIPIRFVFLAYFCLSMACLSKQETTWNYLIVNSFLCSPELSLSFPSWSLNSVLVGQGRITVWSEEKPNFRLSWIEMYNFCMKQRKKCKLFQDRCEMLCSCLASYKADVGKLCNYCLGFFFLNWPYFGTFFSNTFWKEKPNFQTQRFWFFSFGISTMKHFVSDCIEMQCFDILLCGCRAKCLAWNHRGN